MNYFDSSVLVAALRADELEHAACLRAVRTGGVTSTHALLEAFAVLTGYPGPSRLSPAYAAQRLADSFEKRLKPVSLTWAETHTMLAETQARGVRGGAIYDYQHLACARKAGATTLLTLNLGDFLSFARDGDPLIKSPA
jgi:predicted nucleic acid-binding protein